MGVLPDTLLGHGLEDQHEHPIDASAGLQGCAQPLKV